MSEEIIRQGVEEGVFQTPYPDQAARMIIALFEDIGYATSDLILSAERSPADSGCSLDAPSARNT